MSGYKTYAVCILSLVYAITGAVLGYVSWDSAAHLIFDALALSGLRHGLSTSVAKPAESEESESPPAKKRKK